MNKKFMTTLLMTSAFAVALGTTAMAASNKEAMADDRPGAVSDGIKDDRLDKGSPDWKRDRPFDESRRDSGYNVEHEQKRTKPEGISGGIKDDRLDRGNADWQREPVNLNGQPKHNSGYNIPNSNPDPIKDDRLDRGNADWNKK